MESAPMTSLHAAVRGGCGRLTPGKNAKDAWAKVREVIKGKANGVGEQVDGLTAQIMNTHYATISTDNDYRASRLKQTAAEDACLITEMCFGC